MYVYREKPIRKWTGPHKLISAVGKKIMVDVSDRTGPRSFNLMQVKAAKLPYISPLLSPTTKKPKPFEFEHQKPEQQASPQYSIPPISELQGRAAITQPFFTEVISLIDPRTGQFDEAKWKELEGIIKRGTFKQVLREEIGPNPNIVPSRIVLTIKRKENGKEMFKARFVFGGHRDRHKRKIVHSANTLKQSSIRIMLALASILGFDMWATDINQAYLQSASELKREIFVRPDVLELSPDHLL